MNRALLAELQHQRIYPSITVLLNTTPGSPFDQLEQAKARRLAERADERLRTDVPDDVRAMLVARLNELIDEQIPRRTAMALALCVSPEYAAAVQLGRGVEERVVVDDTFATRDLVADLNRTALYRVVTISDRKTRLLVGDRARLVEERTDEWPMLRADEDSQAVWTRQVAQLLRQEHSKSGLPTVLAGVERSVRKLVVPGLFDTIGLIAGNHDRTSWSDLHNLAWPLVSDWLRTDAKRAMDALVQAQSECRFAGGIDEIWPLADEGRVDTLVVEDRYAVSARIVDGQVVRVANGDGVDVVDDLIDDTIEAVLLKGGRAVIVADGALSEHDRIAAVLRY
jgi:hypothetical protein